MTLCDRAQPVRGTPLELKPWWALHVARSYLMVSACALSAGKTAAELSSPVSVVGSHICARRVQVHAEGQERARLRKLTAVQSNVMACQPSSSGSLAMMRLESSKRDVEKAGTVSGKQPARRQGCCTFCFLFALLIDEHERTPRVWARRMAARRIALDVEGGRARWKPGP